MFAKLLRVSRLTLALALVLGAFSLTARAETYRGQVALPGTAIENVCGEMGWHHHHWAVYKRHHHHEHWHFHGSYHHRHEAEHVAHHLHHHGWHVKIEPHHH